MRLIDLKQKEVINICSCSSLGCPADVDFNCITGRIIALIVPGPAKFCGILGREKDIIIPWEAICQIGDDIILVKLPEGPPPPSSQSAPAPLSCTRSPSESPAASAPPHPR
mgnify:CR=1 FL=1